MDSIHLSGLTFYGYHGAFEEERRLGQRFTVQLRLGLDLAEAGTFDDLDRTVNYAAVADVVGGIVQGAPYRLIEALAEAIANALLHGFPRLEEVDVRIEKPAAPIASAPTAQVAVAITRQRDADQPRSLGAGRTDSRAAAPAQGSVLAAAGIRSLLTADPPLVTPITDDVAQVQPNGIDLTLDNVWRLHGGGVLGQSNAERVLPERDALEPGEDGYYLLEPGAYLVRYRETVALPLDMMAFGRSRSSLLRCGAALHTAVWDAGYQGRSESLLVVYASEGIRLAPGARLLQLVFVRLEASTHAYAGVYQRENLPSRAG